MPSEYAARAAQRIADEDAGTQIGPMARIIDEVLGLEWLIPAVKVTLDRFDKPEFNEEDWWIELNKTYEIAIGLRSSN